MKASILAPLALGIALVLPAAGYAAQDHFRPIHSHRITHYKPISPHTTAFAPTIVFSSAMPWSREHERYEREGLSRNPD
jgi:hypothetical protein